MTAVNIKLQLITYIPECYLLRVGSAKALFKTEMHPNHKGTKDTKERKERENEQEKKTIGVESFPLIPEFMSSVEL